MTREEFIGKLRSIYVGEENAIDEIISEYDRVNNIINEAKKYVDKMYDVIHYKDLPPYIDELYCALYPNKLKALKEDNK